MTQTYPAEFLRLSDSQTKRLNVVLCVDGIAECFSTQVTYTTLRYGDPVVYGQAGLVYGGLRRLDDVYDYLSLEGSLSVSQKIEPEQGRSSIQQMSFVIVDKNRLPSQAFFSVGEILGRQVQAKLGYQNSAFPADYITVFRGLITDVKFVAGKIILTCGDLGQKRRSTLFLERKTELTSTISGVVTAIPMNNTSGFYDLVVNENALPVSERTVRPFLKIDDEWLEYEFGSITSSVNINVIQRGARDTVAVSHDINAVVEHAIALKENALTLALKLMISGSGTISLPAAQAYGTVVDPELTPATNVVLFPSGVDLLDQYGLVAGDSITISGSAGNDGVYEVTEIADAFGEPNRLMYLDSALSYENPATGTVTFKSKYDVLPVGVGLKITPVNVDVLGHETIRDQYFAGAEYTLDFFIQAASTGKSFIESQCYLPIGAYALTRNGRLSLGFTRPPLAAQKLEILDETNVKRPENISVARGLNSRTFFNQIQYDYEKNDAGKYEKVIRALDTDSLNQIGLTTILPIKADGIRSGSGELIANRVTRRLLSRYKDAAVLVQLETTFGVGSRIEAGDIVLLKDEGALQIQNFETGERMLGNVLMEVIDRKIDLKSGVCALTLVTGLGLTTDRYGTVAPSSIIAPGSTATELVVENSFGSLDEEAKWAQYGGATLRVHSPDFTIESESVLSSVSETSPNTLILTTALSFIPNAGDVVDLVEYPTSTDPSVEEFAKIIHAFLSPTLDVALGSTATEIQLDPADAAKCVVGQNILVRNADWSTISEEAEVESVNASSITLVQPLSFVPSVGQFVELVGFADNGGPYRIT